MRKTALAAFALVMMASLAAGALAQDNPIIGKWTCDYSSEMGLIVDLEFTEADWVAYVDTGMEVTKMVGAYTIADNVISFQYAEGDFEGTYDSESDEISVTYEGSLYVFQRFVEEEAKEQKQ